MWRHRHRPTDLHFPADWEARWLSGRVLSSKASSSYLSSVLTCLSGVPSRRPPSRHVLVGAPSL